MKFGHRLLSEFNPQWGLPAYVSYIQLKRWVKRLDKPRELVKPPGDVEDAFEFLRNIEAELKKVLEFYEKHFGLLQDGFKAMLEITDAGKLQPAIEALYCDAKVLAEYCRLNREGFSNINKKFVKHSPGRTPTLELSAAIRERALSSAIASKGPEGVLEALTALFHTKVFPEKDLKDALEHLERKWTQDERSKHRIASLEQAAFFRTKASRKEHHYVLRVLTGTSNVLLAEEVCEVLKLSLEDARVGTFANGEIDIKLQNNVRGDDVFIVHTTCGTKTAPYELNKSVMELLLLIHTLRLASAKRITAVVPYLAYSRQDRKTQPRVPISCSAFAQMLLAMGMDRLVTVDLHCGQIQGFFGNTPVDNLAACKEFVKYLREKLPDMSNVCVVSPDAGGVERARILADAIHAQQVVTILKRRVQANVVDSMQIVGDVQGMVCIIIDDMIDTAGTLVKAANLLKEHGAEKVIACATHGILTDPACQRINQCDPLDEVIVTDSIPQVDHLQECAKLHVLTLAPLIAEAIHRIHSEYSLSEIFKIS
eukprot:RCo042996